MYTLTNGVIALGLFETVEEAEKYREEHGMGVEWEIMEIITKGYL